MIQASYPKSTQKNYINFVPIELFELAQINIVNKPILECDCSRYSSLARIFANRRNANF